METEHAIEYLQDFIEDLGVETEHAMEIYDATIVRAKQSHPNFMQLGVRVAMCILTIEACGIDIAKMVMDHKFNKKGSDARISEHVYRYLNRATNLKGSALPLSLPLTGALLVEMMEWDNFRWEHALMAISGNYGLDRKISDRIINLIDATEVEEVCIVPDDYQPREESFRKWDDCSHLYGYPTWAGEDADGDLVVRVRSFTGETEAEDFEVMASEMDIKHLTRYVSDLDTYGPPRSQEMVFVLDPDNEIWSSYIAKRDKVAADDLRPTDDVIPSDGYDMGRVLFGPYIEQKKWSLYIEYWGGMAKEPENMDQMHYSRVSWSIRAKDGFRIDLLGNSHKNGIPYTKSEHERPHTGFLVNWRNTHYKDHEEQWQPEFEWMKSQRGAIEKLIKLATKQMLPGGKIMRWLKVAKVPVDIQETIEARLASDDGLNSLWSLAWALTKQSKGLDEIDAQRLAMAAGDLILFGPLAGDKQLAFDGLVLDF